MSGRDSSPDNELPEPLGAQDANAPGRRRRVVIIAVGVVLLLGGAGVAVVLAGSQARTVKPVAAASTLAAIRVTAKSGLRPFTVTAVLTPALRAYFGGATITGAGIADFRSDKAQWTLTTPAQMGKTIAVFADRGSTYVDVGSTGEWVLLQSAADYRGYDQLPLVRDLVVLTNPFRELNLAESTPAPPHPKQLSLGAWRGGGITTGVMLAAYRRSLPAVTQSVACNNGQATSSQGGQSAQGSPDTKVLTSDFGLSSETDAETMQTVSSWPKTTTTVDSVDSGVCSIDTTVDPTSNGYDITLVFNNPVPPSTATVPRFTVQRTYSYTQVFHYAVPCNQGKWHGTSHVTIPGFSNTDGAVSVRQTDATGGGDLTLSIGSSNASLTTDETFTSQETQVITLPTATGSSTTATTHPVTYTRKFNQDGLAEGFPANPPGATGNHPSVALDLTLSGDVALSETGSFIGSRDDVRPAAYGLHAIIDCTTHELTLNSTAFGDIALTRVSAAPPVLQSTSLSQNWRTQFLQHTTPPTPTPPMPTSSAPPGPPPPLAANVLGAGKTAWATHHHADPAIDGDFDPNPGAYPGSVSQDRFLGVQDFNGLVDSYTQQLPPHTSQQAADSQVRAFLPADAVLAVPATPLGRCAAEEWTSRSLAAAEGKGSQGTITVTYDAQYGFGPTSYNANDNRTAFVQTSFGGVIPGSELTATICG